MLSTSVGGHWRGPCGVFKFGAQVEKLLEAELAQLDDQWLRDEQVLQSLHRGKLVCGKMLTGVSVGATTGIDIGACS